MTGMKFIKNTLHDVLGSWPYMKLELIFSGSEIGWTTYRFHSRCDNKGPTLTLIKTVEGRIFGGYTSVSWTSSYGESKSDPDAFVFTVLPD